MNILSKGRLWLYGKLIYFQSWKYRILYIKWILEKELVFLEKRNWT